MKHTTLTINEETFEKAKRLGINISAALRDYLQILINRETQNLEGINIELERSNLIKLQKQLLENQIKIKQHQDHIEIWESAKAAKEKKDLEAEKKRIEALAKCTNCGSQIVGKTYKVRDNRLCKACFLSK